jgi:hypothetical protein
MKKIESDITRRFEHNANNLQMKFNLQDNFLLYKHQAKQLNLHLHASTADTITSKNISYIIM